ncbi:MAG: hypothetical protein JXB48_05815 [Candidatus Latescibacteria bacterium]|nr:hypothetical protein [Candidatus Latescibacterota bacterium]
MDILLRRILGIGATLLIITGGIFYMTGCSTDQSGPDEETYFPELGNYADLYLRMSYDLLHMIKVRELGKIGEASKIGAQRKMSGGKTISGIGTPHIMYGGACAGDIPGNPNIAPDPKGQNSGYPGTPELGPNDFLMVANPSEHVEKAYKNGCYVVGIGFPMTTNRYSPLNFNDHPDYFIEDMTNMFIYTWGPKEDGIVTPALTPTLHLKILPTSPMTVVGYWLLTAQLAHNLAYKDTSGTHQAAETYIDTLMERLSAFHERYIGAVNNVGEEIADRVLSGGRIHPWSPRNEFWIESNGTAGGLMGVYPLKPDSLTSKDVVILALSNATPEEEIGMAQKIRDKNAFLIGIFPFEREDNIPTAPLRELCDLSLDNLSGDVYGVLDIPGYPNKIIPTTTMMNNFAFWAVVGGYVQAMEKRGEAPYYWMSYHVPGGREYDESIRDDFLKRGY